jgi:hypothetical protein
MKRLLFAAAIAWSVPAAAQVVTLHPVADALLSAAHPTSNYGGAGALAVSAAGLPKGEFASLLRFDLAPARSSFDALFGPGLWTIESITLTLTAAPPGHPLFNGNGAGPGGTNVNSAGLFSLRWMQNDAWTEGTGTPVAPSVSGINFNGLPALLGASDEALGLLAFNGATTGSTTYPLALTAGFTADAAGGNLVSLVAQAADSGVGLLVNSRSVAVASSRPALTIVAVPEPGAATLALAGGLALAGRRRRT